MTQKLTPRRRAMLEANRIVKFWHAQGHDHVWVRIERYPLPGRPNEYFYPLTTNLRNGMPPPRRCVPGAGTGGVHATFAR